MSPVLRWLMVYPVPMLAIVGLFLLMR